MLIKKGRSKLVAAILLCAFAAACEREANDESARPAAPSEADIAAAREAAQVLGETLKARLLAAIAEGGPVSAIEVCAQAAPEIAATVSDQTGMSVGRTALRVRNPNNAPDDWERRQLQSFLDALENGADPASLEAAAIVTVGGAPVFRWMKPIMMGGPCTLCHGEAVSDEVKAAIAARYPSDQATGFKLGELRGAFTVTKTPPSDERTGL